MSLLNELERETDPLDTASNHSLADTHLRVEEQRRKAAPQQKRNEKGEWPTTECEECGNEIGAARLEATGSKFCVDCATLKEQKEKQYGRR